MMSPWTSTEYLYVLSVFPVHKDILVYVHCDKLVKRGEVGGGREKVRQRKE